MRIVQIHRKRNQRFFSIETVFEQVRNAWEIDPKPEVWVLPRPGISLSNCLYVWKMSRSVPSDTIFHITGDALYIALALPRNRTTLTVHDCVFMRQRKGLKRLLIRKLSLEWPIRFCRLVTAISQNTQNEVVTLTGCDPGKIRIVPNPVSNLIRHVPRPFLAERTRVLFFGVTPNKNLPRALEAMEGLNVTLVLIGEPDAFLQDLLAKSKVHFEVHHGLTDREVASFYESSDLVLFPSLYEGFGLPITEGFKAGRPVITSNIPPMSDIAGDAACLVDPEDVGSIRQGILRLCNDAAYRDELVGRGLERAVKYAPVAIARKYRSIYEELVKGRVHKTQQ